MLAALLQSKLVLYGLICLATALAALVVGLLVGRKKASVPGKQVSTDVAFRPTLRLRSLNLGTQRIIVIDSVDFLIGSDPKCNLVLDNDATISHEHCRIVYKNGKHMAIDLDSKNHTYLNGKILPPMKEFVIASGDSISFSYSFDFTVESAFKE